MQDLQEILADPDMLPEIDKHPQSFGLSYENWKLQFVDLDKICREQLDSLIPSARY
jgi:hypothetical protein